MKYYFWACDYSNNTGEGNLARLFVKKEIRNGSHIKFNNKFTLFRYKYILPFIGVIYCWFYYFKGKKIYYLNYLPLWNFLIFILLPPKTSLGPITGGSNYNRSIVRKYIFPILYYLSQIIINLRYNDIIFSTSLLKKYLFNSVKKKSKFDFVFNLLNKNKTNKKNIDFLIYYRKHKNKEKFFPYKFIKKLLSNKFKIFIFGDQLKLRGLKNLGKINNDKVNWYLRKSYFSISSGENLLSLFTLECINNNVKILLNNNFNEKIPKKLKSNFIKISFKEKNIKKKLEKFYL